MKDKYLFLARDSTWRNSAWRLLNGEFLVIPVDSVDFIDSEGALFLTDHTRAELTACLDVITVEAWAFKITTFTSEVNLLVLRENTGSLYNDTSEFNQSIQMNLA